MYSFDDLTERTKESTLIYDGKILHVFRDEVDLPGGGIGSRELIRHIGAVCIIPVTEDGRVVMEHQYRYPVAAVVTEIPAGKLDSSDEDRLLAAQRELAEETGYTADHWTDLGLYYPAPAYSDEKITIYLAQGLHKGSQKFDGDEFLNIEEIPLTDLVDAVMSGRITDGKTQVAVLKAAMHLGLIRA